MKKIETYTFISIIIKSDFSNFWNYVENNKTFLQLSKIKTIKVLLLILCVYYKYFGLYIIHYDFSLYYKIINILNKIINFVIAQ